MASKQLTKTLIGEYIEEKPRSKNKNSKKIKKIKKHKLYED
jgi:hypothetical protein